MLIEFHILQKSVLCRCSWQKTPPSHSPLHPRNPRTENFLYWKLCQVRTLSNLIPVPYIIHIHSLFIYPIIQDIEHVRCEEDKIKHTQHMHPSTVYHPCFMSLQKLERVLLGGWKKREKERKGNINISMYKKVLVKQHGW